MKFLMDIQEIIRITKEELSNIGGLSNKEDEVKIDTYPNEIYFSYTSSKYTEFYNEQGNLSDRGITHITFRIKQEKLNECLITSLGVNPRYERQGLARKMIGIVEQIAEKIAIPLIILGSPFTSAIPFWEKIGYSQVRYNNKQTLEKRL